MRNRTFRKVLNRWSQLRADRHLYLATAATVLLVWVLIDSIEYNRQTILPAIRPYSKPTRPAANSIPSTQSLSDCRTARYGDVEWKSTGDIGLNRWPLRCWIQRSNSVLEPSLYR